MPYLCHTPNESHHVGKSRKRQDRSKLETGACREFQQPYFAEIKDFLVREKQAGKVIYPPGPLIFNAFNTTPFDQVQVVILGQDPYHNPGEAMGLCFSVPKGVRCRPRWSIFTRKSTATRAAHSCTRRPDTLGRTRGAAAQRHAHRGGRQTRLAPENRLANVHGCRHPAHFRTKGRRGVPAVGDKFAKAKKRSLMKPDTMCRSAPHPSPLAGNGFQGCGHFQAGTNEILTKQGKKTIDWSV